MRLVHLPLAIAVALVLGSVSTVLTQGRGQATPPRQWWVNKDKPGQFGKNKVHIKLTDLKARHKGQASWSEVVVDDENYHSTYNQGAPGTKITSRMRPDTREFFVVVEGEMRFTLEGSPADSGHAWIGREYPKKDHVLSGSHRRGAGPLGRRQSGEFQNARAGERSTTAAVARAHPDQDRHDLRSGCLHGEQQAALQPVGCGERSEVRRTERRPGRSHVGASDLGLYEKICRLRPEDMGTSTSAPLSGG